MKLSNIMKMSGIVILGTLFTFFLIGCASAGAHYRRYPDYEHPRYEHEHEYDHGYEYEDDYDEYEYEDEYAYGPNYGYRGDVYSILEPYGTWVFIAEFGYCWRPSVYYNWRPFMFGRWVWNGYGWMWISYEPFGWLVYHYGYWWFHPAYGWVWIPRFDQWSPARVTWIYSGGYIGWAPLPPPGYSWPQPWRRMRHHRSMNRVNVWVFVNIQYFGTEDIYRYAQTRVPRLFRKPKTRGYGMGYTRTTPPTYYEVQRHARVSIPVVTVRKQEIRIGKTKVYRPMLPSVLQSEVQTKQKKLTPNIINIKPAPRKPVRPRGKKDTTHPNRNVRKSPKYREKDTTHQERKVRPKRRPGWVQQDEP